MLKVIHKNNVEFVHVFVATKDYLVASYFQSTIRIIQLKLRNMNKILLNMDKFSIRVIMSS